MFIHSLVKYCTYTGVLYKKVAELVMVWSYRAALPQDVCINLSSIRPIVLDGGGGNGTAQL